MVNLVKVRTLYDNNIKYYRINTEESLQKGAMYVGSTRFGHDLVEIHCPSRMSVSEEQWQKMLEHLGISDDKKNSRSSYEPVLHYLAKESEIKGLLNGKKELETYLAMFRNKSTHYQLSMKIVKLHYTYKQERLVCFYTSEQRVDFREFIKDVGAALKIRIEMFQISARDAATLMDACGVCGLRLCCLMGCNLSRTVADKKTHNTKSLGVCGKGRCCLSYEIPTDIEPDFPEIGTYVVGTDTLYTVISLEEKKRRIVLSGAEGSLECSLDHIRKVRDGDLIHFEYKSDAST